MQLSAYYAYNTTLLSLSTLSKVLLLFIKQQAYVSAYIDSTYLKKFI